MSQPLVDSDVNAPSGRVLLRRHLLPLLLIIPILLLARQEDDSLQVGSQPDSVQVSEQPDTLAIQAPDSALTGPLFHNPPVAMLNDRPFRFDLFVDFDPGTIKSVSLFFRCDSSHTYREISLEGEYNRYQHTLRAEELRGGTLTYYFLVTLKDYSLWAYPTSEEGSPQPFVIDLVPPTKEFFQKRYYD